MIEAIANNAGTIIVVLILTGIVTAAVFKLLKDKRKGKSSCGCSCGCCPMAGSCHKQT